MQKLKFLQISKGKNSIEKWANDRTDNSEKRKSKESLNILKDVQCHE